MPERGSSIAPGQQFGTRSRETHSLLEQNDVFGIVGFGRHEFLRPQEQQEVQRYFEQSADGAGKVDLD